MSFQQQNLPEPAHSLEHQMGLSDNENDPISKPFSIRQYVLDARQKDIAHSWPFPERYLQVCLKHGVSNVLPPLEPWDSATIRPQREGSLEYSQKEEENVVSSEIFFMKIDAHEEIIEIGCDSFFDEAISGVSTQVCHLSLSSNNYSCGENNQLNSDSMVPRPSTTMPSLHPHVVQSAKALTLPKRLRHKRWKHKGKSKKRSMADVLAVAKYCTLKDLDKVEGLGCSPKKALENVSEENLRINIVEHGCKSELTEECLEKNHQRDDNSAANDNITGNRRLVMKIKLNRCNTKSWNGELENCKPAEIKIIGSSKANSPEIYGSTSNLEFQDASQGDRTEVCEESCTLSSKCCIDQFEESRHLKKAEIMGVATNCSRDGSIHPATWPPMEDASI